MWKTKPLMAMSLCIISGMPTCYCMFPSNSVKDEHLSRHNMLLKLDLLGEIRGLLLLQCSVSVHCVLSLSYLIM